MLGRDKLRILNKLNGCKKCGGNRYVSIQTGNKIQLKKCSCLKRVEEEIVCIKANIPRQYRHWNISKLTPEFKEKNKRAVSLVSDYIKNLDKNIEKSRGLWFTSMPGLAKSSIITYILRQAAQRGYRAYFERASHILNLKFDSLGKNPEAAGILRRMITEVDILAIEEFEKVYLSDKEMPRHLFFEFLSDVYDAQVTLLVSSNKLREDVEKNMPYFIKDRLRSLVHVPLAGPSGRGSAE